MMTRSHSLFVLRTATPEDIEEIKARGQALWNSIYEPHAKKLADKLGAYHPDFIGTSDGPPQEFLTTHYIAPSLSVLVLFVSCPLHRVPPHRHRIAFCIVQPHFSIVPPDCPSWTPN